MMTQTPRKRKHHHNSLFPFGTQKLHHPRLNTRMSLGRLFCCWVFMLMAATISTFSSAGLSSSVSANLKIEADTAGYNGPQEKKYYKFPVKKGANADGALDLNDYRQYDPSPNSRSRIHSGPIYHNTPLNPHIPKSPPHLKGHKQSPVPSPV